MTPREICIDLPHIRLAGQRWGDGETHRPRPARLAATKKSRLRAAFSIQQNYSTPLPTNCGLPRKMPNQSAGKW